MKIKDEEYLATKRGPGRCEYCGKLVKWVDPHHIFARGMGGGGRLDIPINIISLCVVFSGGNNCHHEVHAGKIKREELVAIVAEREGVTPEFIEEEVYRLRRMRK